MVKPVPDGTLAAPNALFPHAAIDPSLASAAKALLVENMAVKPMPAGALLPPFVESPHTAMEPSLASAAKAPSVE